MCYFVAVHSQDGYDCVVLDPRGLTVRGFVSRGMSPPVPPAVPKVSDTSDNSLITISVRL